MIFYVEGFSNKLSRSAQPHLKLSGADLSLIVQWSTPPTTENYHNSKSKLYKLCSSLLGGSQEDNPPVRQPHRKTTSQEENLHGRKLYRKKMSLEDNILEDDITGRWSDRKITSQEGNLKWRQHKIKTTSRTTLLRHCIVSLNKTDMETFSNETYSPGPGKLPVPV